jgi:biotin carboxyl carrier protein
VEAPANGLHEGIVKTYTVTVNGEELSVTLDNGAVVAVNGENCSTVTVQQTARHQYSVIIDGESVTLAAGGSSGRYELFTEGRLYQVQVASERERFRKQFRDVSTGPLRTEVRAPMPALVVKIEVSIGEAVVEGQGLVVLEAMKMENEIRAQASGKVKDIKVTAGEAVEKDELLILLE